MMRSAECVGQPTVVVLGVVLLPVVQNLIERPSRLCRQLAVKEAQVHLIEEELSVD
jgi:hypothetical protein